MLGSAPAAASPPRVQVPEALARDYEIDWDPQTGCVCWMHARWGDPMGMGHEGCASYSIFHTSIPGRALDFLTAHADLFRLREGVDELALVEAYECLGSYYVKFEGRYRDVRVAGAWFQVRLDPRRRIEAVGAHVVPDIELDTTPRISREEAAAIAAKAVENGILARTVVGELGIYRHGDPPLPPSEPGEASDALLLAWPVRVGIPRGYPWNLLVDARNGDVLTKHQEYPIDR